MLRTRAHAVRAALAFEIVPFCACLSLSLSGSASGSLSCSLSLSLSRSRSRSRFLSTTYGPSRAT